MTTFDNEMFTGLNEIPSTERGRARWRKIVAVAGKIFEERGVDVPLSEIVKETGGSLTTFYKWFGNKEALLLMVLCARVGEIGEAIESVKLSGSTIVDDIDETVEAIGSRAPFGLIRAATLKSDAIAKYKTEILKAVEDNSNEPLARVFKRIREKRGIEFTVSDEDLALIFVRFFRGLFVEIALGADDGPARFNEGKRIIKDVLVALASSKIGVEA